MKPISSRGLWSATGHRPFGRLGRPVVMTLAVSLVALAGLYLDSRHGSDRPTQATGSAASPGSPGLTREVQFSPRRPAFDLSDATIPVDQIRAGGPPKDGIPALTDPPMITAAEAAYLTPDDRIIGYAEGDDARAYPLRILNYHELINDRVSGKPILITYCPLCDSAAIFDRRTPLGEREFGVSGLLYNSNVLMYDRGGQPESLWSQIRGAGVTGPAAGVKLRPLPVELTTWQAWLRRYPHSQVLSANTGHRRDYRRSPYDPFLASPRLMFPVETRSDRLPAKTAVLGVWVGDTAKAYPLAAFGGPAEEIEDTLAGHRIRLAFDPAPDRLRVVSADEDVRWMYSLWYAWYAFRPQTEVFTP